MHTKLSLPCEGHPWCLCLLLMTVCKDTAFNSPCSVCARGGDIKLCIELCLFSLCHRLNFACWFPVASKQLNSSHPITAFSFCLLSFLWLCRKTLEAQSRAGCWDSSPICCFNLLRNHFPYICLQPPEFSLRKFHPCFGQHLGGLQSGHTTECQLCPRH